MPRLLPLERVDVSAAVSELFCPPDNEMEPAASDAHGGGLGLRLPSPKGCRNSLRRVAWCRRPSVLNSVPEIPRGAPVRLLEDPPQRVEDAEEGPQRSFYIEDPP